jgi:hypothetical protein
VLHQILYRLHLCLALGGLRVDPEPASKDPTAAEDLGLSV